MNTNPIGHLLTPEILHHLDQLFPNACPRLADSDREIWIKVGERRVVEVLRARYEQAQQESSDGIYKYASFSSLSS